jgi:hypothetical protein
MIENVCLGHHMSSGCLTEAFVRKGCPPEGLRGARYRGRYAAPGRRPGILSVSSDSCHLAAVDEQAIEGLKFSACLPHELALDMLQSRLGDPVSLQWVLNQPVRLVWA